MSFNKVIPHPQDAYVELVVDGYEDWESATDSIVEMTDLAERYGFCRFLIDFRRVDMRVSPAEAPDIATFFNSFCPFGFSMAVILPEDAHAARTARAFADAIAALGRTVRFLTDEQERAVWAVAGRSLKRRTGAA